LAWYPVYISLMMENRYSFHLNAYLAKQQITDAARFVLREYGLEHPNLLCFKIGHPSQKDSLLLTAEGQIGQRQIVNIPANLFEFEPALYLNLLAHEMLHVAQKSASQMMEDKNEREWQAYYEMLFHVRFPQIPAMSNYYLMFFAQKALVYYERMGLGSVLQEQYQHQKMLVERIVTS
jgi:hypothetical protein